MRCHVRQYDAEADEGDDVGDASIHVVGDGTLDWWEDRASCVEVSNVGDAEMSLLYIPETPMTRMPAPRRVLRPKFAVPSVKIDGYIGASKKKMQMSTATAGTPWPAQM